MSKLKGILLFLGLMLGSLSWAQDSTFVDANLTLDTQDSVNTSIPLTSTDSFKNSNTSSTNFAIDSVKLLDKMRLNPKKAGLYSALVPGGGQIYNQEYWKLPIVYGAIGTGIGFIIHNSKNYNSARLEYSKRMSLKTDLNPKYSRYDMYMLQQEQDYYKEYLDMSVLLTSLGYLLQIMDAVAFNHLKGFDISPDISARFKMSQLDYGQLGFGIALYYNK